MLDRKYKSNQTTVLKNILPSTELVSETLNPGLYYIIYIVEFNSYASGCFYYGLKDKTSNSYPTSMISHYNGYNTGENFRSCEYIILNLKQKSEIAVVCTQNCIDNLLMLGTIVYYHLR